MREYFVGHDGREWAVPSSKGRLKFRIPSHAALRALVFRRDGFRCVRCPAKAVDVPESYDGRFALFTDTKVKARKTVGEWRDVLVVDHVLTLRAGGNSSPGNLQTLCETCNKRKQREDRIAARGL